MKRLNITLLTSVLLALFLVSCDKDPVFKEGDYLYATSDELKYLENYDGILINWSDFVTEEQQEVIREIVSNMVRVESGTFQMGSDDELAAADEVPVHAVTLSSYRINKFTVTQKQWRVLMGTDLGWNSNYGVGDNLPTTHVTYADCKAFLTELNWLSGLNFRLPTEAEWEYAARGGKKAHGCRYSGKNKAGGVAWFVDNSGNKTHNVKGKTKNELGLYDMSGNVWEWCADWYGNYAPGSYVDPQGPAEGTYRVLRGGCWNSNDWYCRVSNRSFNNPDYAGNGYGFRLVLQQSNESKE
jgi:formylglycine-generating enzyme required for sulfatase activity